jgi:hypothetical protein
LEGGGGQGRGRGRGSGGGGAGGAFRAVNAAPNEEETRCCAKHQAAKPPVTRLTGSPRAPAADPPHNKPEAAVAVLPAVAASACVFYGVRLQGSLVVFWLAYFSILCTGIGGWGIDCGPDCGALTVGR